MIDISLDDKLACDNYLDNLCKKVNRSLPVLARVTPYTCF